MERTCVRAEAERTCVKAEAERTRERAKVMPDSAEGKCCVNAAFAQMSTTLLGMDKACALERDAQQVSMLYDLRLYSN